MENNAFSLTEEAIDVCNHRMIFCRYSATFFKKNNKAKRHFPKLADRLTITANTQTNRSRNKMCVDLIAQIKPSLYCQMNLLAFWRMTFDFGRKRAKTKPRRRLKFLWSQRNQAGDRIWDRRGVLQRPGAESWWLWTRLVQIPLLCRR